MYLELFNLVDRPFQLTPDPDYLYMSHSHSRAMAYMDYSIWNQEGFVVITGEVGAGKTLLVHKLLSELTSNVVVAKIFQTQLDDVEFLQAMLVEYGLNPFRAKKVELMDMLNTFLIETYGNSKQAILLVDDAQNLDTRVLEEIRMLSNLEIKNEKILHIILVGQPELGQKLELPELEQLLQRVRLRFHIKPLSQSECKDYITHRLRVAGAGSREIFEDGTFSLIYEYSGGLPRLINTLCDTSLTCAYADDISKITKNIVMIAIDELGWVPYSERKIRLKKNELSENKNTTVQEARELEKILRANTQELKKLGEKIGSIKSLAESFSIIGQKVSSIESLISSATNNSDNNSNASYSTPSPKKISSENSKISVTGNKIKRRSL